MSNTLSTLNDYLSVPSKYEMLRERILNGDIELNRTTANVLVDEAIKEQYNKNIKEKDDKIKELEERISILECCIKNHTTLINNLDLE